MLLPDQSSPSKVDLRDLCMRFANLVDKLSVFSDCSKKKICWHCPDLSIDVNNRPVYALVTVKSLKYTHEENGKFYIFFIFFIMK